ncbi:MAG TPA: cytochrome P450 [Steroidobacteraceae bacterium]|nr:cytochrome P450 [Steroidobacteraceae bacterium]
MAKRIPRDPRFDNTRALFRDPYGFVAARTRRLGSDVFETRILLRRTLCLSGSQAAALLYDRERFRRRGATPGSVRSTLFGKGGVQGLDDEAHRRRKQMLMSLMTPERVRALAVLAIQQWEGAARQWMTSSRVVLYDELQKVLCRAACAWTGVSLAEAHVSDRTRDLASLYNEAALIPWGHLRARRARRRLERWIGALVGEVRTGRLAVAVDTPIGIVARHTDERGRLLAPRVAAVEVLNLLRPIVALSVYIVSLAHALREHPEWRARIAADPTAAEWFVQEVRRFYPFFPVIFARVRRDFEWHGYAFKRGRRALLDVYGTDHDPRTWEAPEEFRPERFASWREDPFALVPQGGGDHCPGHRCAGEALTLELLKRSLGFLLERLQYEVPNQDLRIDRARLPALPRDRFVVTRVKLLDAAGQASTPRSQATVSSSRAAR